ncbi:hypothetical protein IIA79_06715 [bacterium]|nr:hypothetical protein [bacterium]
MRIKEVISYQLSVISQLTTGHGALTPALALLLIALAACRGASGPPVDYDAVRAAVVSALGIINIGIEREDPILASQPLSELFTMGGNVAIRYSDEIFPEGEGAPRSGIALFRGFFADAFEVHANIFHSFTLIELDLSGEVATATVEVEFNSLRVDRNPPENHVASGTDYLVFQLEGGAWRLVSWDEVPPPFEEPPHDAGEGEDL